jgi:DNA-binding beta-propeller fold protein YncE
MVGTSVDGEAVGTRSKRLEDKPLRVGRRHGVLAVTAAMALGAGTLVGTAGSASAAATGYAVINTINLRTAANPYVWPQAVAVDPSNHNVYVGSDPWSGNGGTLSVIDESGDATTGKVGATIPIEGAPDAVVVDPSNHNVYVASQTNDDHAYLSVIDESGDARSGTVTNLVYIGAGSYPRSLAVDSSSHNVYIANYLAGTVEVLNESGNAHTGDMTSISVGGDPYTLAVDSSNHNLYVNDLSNVAVVDESGDANTGKIMSVIKVPNSRAMAVDPGNHNLYIDTTDPITGAGLVEVVNESGGPSFGKVTVRIPLGGGGTALAVDTATHQVLATENFEEDVSDGFAIQSGKFWVIDESGDARNNQVTEAAYVGDQIPQTVAVDSSTGAAYLANWAGTVTVLGAVRQSPADIGLSLNGPTRAADGSRFTENVTVTDHGPAEATSVHTNLSVPAGLTVTSAPGASLDTGTLAWLDAAIQPGASITHEVTFTVAKNVHANASIGGVSVSFAEKDRDLANDDAIATIRLG